MKSCIVVIDNSLNIKKLVSKKLNGDVTLKTFATGKQGISFLMKAKNVSLIVSSFQLKDMDSSELAKVLKSFKALKKVPHIVVSDTGNEEDKIACLQNGAIDVIEHPFDHREFELRLRRFVGAFILQD